jgi:hypothetical protein
MSRRLLLVNMPEVLGESVPAGVIEVVRQDDLRNVLARRWRLNQAIAAGAPIALILRGDDDFELARRKLAGAASIKVLMIDDGHACKHRQG